ncbi:MAG: response regulator [Magnetococcales bacterium]|nr:response regulator [Magnetococcales bacterium]
MPKATILIVDDQPITIQILDGILHEAYRVLFASNGMEALESVEDHKPDLILLDVVMPGVDGHQVCSILKSDPATRSIPIVFITAMNDEQAAETGKRLGAEECIVKPIDPATVLTKIRHILGQATPDA